MPPTPQLPAGPALLHTPMSRRLALTGLAVAAAGCSSSTSTTSSSTSTASSLGTPGTSGSAVGQATPTPTPTPAPELPRGGRTVFPDHRLFGYCGSPGAPGQGRLGIGDLDQKVAEIEKRSVPYARGRKILPVMELIVSTVLPHPGKDGKWRGHVEEATIQTWHQEARKRKAYLLLNIQPGRADFVDELKYFEKWLVHPDVGVALDPEWSMGPGEVPMRVFGHTTGADLDRCAAWLSDLVARHNLPEKVMVYHQLSPVVVRKESGLKPHPGVALVKSVDGIGSPGAKVDTWKRLMKTTPKFVHPGFKLFYQEDVQQGGRLMTPAEVMALKPTPDYVLFE